MEFLNYYSNNSTGKHNTEGEWENKNNVSGVFIEQQKAFDCINWKILIPKLEKARNRGSSCPGMGYSLFQEQATELKSTIKVTTVRMISEPASLQRGVPQGSILGHLFILIYNNDLQSQLSIGTDCLMYYTAIPLYFYLSIRMRI